MNQQLHVIFGTGASGQAVMRELVRRGHKVRITSRHPKLEGSEQVDVVAGDASDAEFCKQVCAGATVVYNCANAPYDKWAELLEPLFMSILEGAAAAGAKLVIAENLYMYGRVDGPMTEETPINPCSRKGEIRGRLAEKMLQAHREGKVKLTVCRASDFFGPFVTMSTLGAQVFAQAVKGSNAMVLGNPDKLHTYTYIDDLARAMITLSEHDDAFGEVWHAPSGETLRTREFVELVFRAAGNKPKLIASPRWMISVMGWFKPVMRELKEMLYQFENDFVMDSSKFRSRFGDTSTKNEDAVRETVHWFRDHYKS